MVYIKLRGHHLICRLGFRGLGYDERFIDKMTEVVNKLKDSPNLMVSISDSPDILCNHCPNLKDGVCKSSGSDLSEERVSKMDRMVASALGIKLDKEYEVEELNYRLKTLLTKNSLEAICRDCRWSYLGYCEEGLEMLKLTKEDS